MTVTGGGDVLLDRDGVIVVNRDDYVRTPDDLELLPGAAEAISRLNRAGRRVAVVTNQAVVGRGYISTDDLAAIHLRLDAELLKRGAHIDAYYVCPHHPDDGCDCRKPKPGLIFQAERDGTELATAVFVGDAVTDARAAEAAGCAFILVGAADAAPLQVTRAADLAAAVDIILGTSRVTA